jgi:voltage-gated potassium channel Kch
MRAVSILRQHYPELPILARGRDRAECVALEEAGATATVLEAMESGLHLGMAVLQALGIEDGDAARAMTKFRANNYAGLRDIIPPGGAKAARTAQRGARHP